MRFTEHELTIAVTTAAKSVAAAKARRRKDPEVVWESTSKIDRYHLLDGVGSQVLPVLIALPDIEVEAGSRPTFTDAQVKQAVEQVMAQDDGRSSKGLRRKVELAARVALVNLALGALPPRQDPDGLVVPDSL